MKRTIAGAATALFIFSAHSQTPDTNSRAGGTVVPASKSFELSVWMWLDPLKPNWPAASPWWGFYNYAIAIAKNVDSGKISDEAGRKLIEERRLALNQELAAAAAPKVVTLNCALSGPDGKPVERAIMIDYSNLKVSGYPANFYENEIRWSYKTGAGANVNNTLNRLSGFLQIGDEEFPALITGRCVPGVKQF